MASIIFAMGFFAIAAQTLLFRVFFQVYDGNELGIAAFFGSWLIWVGIGAIAARLVHKKIGFGPNFGILVLGYLPAFIFQQYILGYSRSLAGVTALEIFPYLKMFAVSLFLNAPLSLVTGFLFTAACKVITEKRNEAVKPVWFRQIGSVNLVYMLEVLGSFAGGIFVTFLLFLSIPETRIFILASIILSFSAFLFYKQKSYQYNTHLPATPPTPKPDNKTPLFSILHFPFSNPPKWICGTIFVACFLALLLNIDLKWDNLRYQGVWQRLLPLESYEGRFTTPGSTYLYGTYNDSLVVQAYGNIVDSIPDFDTASDVMAVHLAQKPDAKEVLVISASDISLCIRFLSLPQIRKVTWLCPDPIYQQKILDNKFVQSVLPDLKSNRFQISAKDIRTFLKSTNQKYDLVITSFPGSLTSANNRYFTVEFYNLLRARMSKNAVLGVSLQAGENYLGKELIRLGQSLLATLKAVFPYQELKPGEDSWVLASDRRLKADPVQLEDRLSKVPGLAEIFPPARIGTLYQTQRAAFQLGLYNRIDSDINENTDRNPQGYLFSLLFESQHTGRVFAFLAYNLIRYKFKAIFLVILCLLSGRIAFLFAQGQEPVGSWLPKISMNNLWSIKNLVQLKKFVENVGKSPAPEAINSYDYMFLIGSMGFIGMALQVLLMFYFETLFGSLYLYVGLISSLFMLGLFFGSVLGSYIRRVFVVLFLHLTFILFLWLGQSLLVTKLLFMVLFLISGLFCGLYIPISEAALKTKKLLNVTIGMNLEIADHMGGAAGALLIGLFFLPVFGVSGVLLIIALVFLLNISHHLVSLLTVRKSEITKKIVCGYDVWDLVIKRIGLVLGSFCLFLLLLNALNSYEAVRERKQSLLTILKGNYTQTIIDKGSFKRVKLNSGKDFNYFSYVADNGQKSYVFHTLPMDLSIMGYGGLLDILVEVQDDGILKEVRLISSRETPYYLDFVWKWMKGLKGKNVFPKAGIEPQDDLTLVKAVSGATVSSKAVLDILLESGRIFSEQVLEIGYGLPGKLRVKSYTGNTVFFLVFSFLVSIALFLKQFLFKVWYPLVRRCFLIVVLGIGGYWLNAQYSLFHIFAVSDLVSFSGFSFSFILGAGVLFIVILFGNIYCGYLCPFGAFQELVNDLRKLIPGEFACFLSILPPKRFYRFGRWIKYFLFLGISILVFVGYGSVIEADPLNSFFQFPMLFAWLLLGISFFVNRFWCRILCPTGVFLAVIAKMRLFFKQNIAPNCCDLGVIAAKDIDCIACDRCLTKTKLNQENKDKKRVIVFFILVTAFTLTFIWQIFLLVKSLPVSKLELKDQTTTRRELYPQSMQQKPSLSGKPRDLDLKLIKNLIQQRKLSSKKALFWGK